MQRANFHRRIFSVTQFLLTQELQNPQTDAESEKEVVKGSQLQKYTYGGKVKKENRKLERREGICGSC